MFTAVCTREANSGRLSTATASDFELRTLHLYTASSVLLGEEVCLTYVELSSWVRTSAVKSNHLVAQQVLPSCDALWNLESDLALVRNHAVYAPRLVGRVQTILPDFEPF